MARDPHPSTRPPDLWGSIVIGAAALVFGVLQLAGVIGRGENTKNYVGEGPLGPSIIIAAGIGIATFGIARHLRLKRRVQRLGERGQSGTK